MSILTVHAVFDVNPDSRFRKDFWRRYEISNRPAVEIARSCVGDWIVFRQTGVGGYVAAARVDEVRPDAERPGFYIAVISGYLPFTSPVPFKTRGLHAETRFRIAGRSLHIGKEVQGKPIRVLPPFDFETITLAGFRRTIKLSGDAIMVPRAPTGFDEPDDAFTGYEPVPRDMRTVCTLRAVRDANFRLEVCGRYNYTCAFTDMALVDGQFSEVDAAHAWSVLDDGPDIVQNGLCLSKTPHWAFDRHLISVDENYRPLVAPGALPQKFLNLFPPSGETIHLPRHPREWPGKEFLDRHRAIFRRKHRL